MSINKNVKVIDELNNTLSEIEEWSEQNSIQIVYCTEFDRQGLPNALWRGNKDWKEFLESAKRFGCKIIWIQINSCHISEKSELKELLPDSEYKNVESLLDGAQKFAEKIASIYVYWVFGSVVNCLISDAEWVDEYYEFEEELDGVISSARNRLLHETQDREAEQHDRETEEMAKKLLRHPKYSECRNLSDRMYLAKKLFGPTIPYRQVAELAETIKRIDL